jgi:hypothetical protein
MTQVPAKQLAHPQQILNRERPTEIISASEGSNFCCVRLFTKDSSRRSARQRVKEAKDKNGNYKDN